MNTYLLSATRALLMLVSLCWMQAGAMAAERDAVGFASVWRLAGDVVAIGEGGHKRRLRVGDSVFVGERVQAGPSSEALLKTVDSGLIAVRPGAQFTAESFVAKGNKQDSFTLRLITGALRVVTGWIGRLNPSEQRIVTPTATIGVRGTDHEPYVMTTELAGKLAQKEGTYDKVNKGGTTLDTGNATLDIEPGRVGFMRSVPKTKTRALMTLTLPVLLERVPEFYVPGRFDDEIEQMSASLETEVQSALEKHRSTPLSTLQTPSTESPGAPASDAAQRLKAPPGLSPMLGKASPPDDACESDSVARKWLAWLDNAIARRDVDGVLELFAADLNIRVRVRNMDGSHSVVDLNRNEFAQSATRAISGLSEFRQRRPSIDGKPAEAGHCERIAVNSLSIEQGKQNGLAYRFESLEEFVLERRDGRWIAIKAETTQR